MVKKRQTKRQRDIKTKLMAAICMLLVSSIMMVSTTYAWFTLSTAPEVTGITTAVGANGNLEMALLPADGALDSIKSEAGDSIKAINDRNITWGNLVDVSDDTFYGMNQIKLYPAALNVSTWDSETNPLNPTKLAEALLKTPTYGADGRVAELLANTVTSTYNSTTTNFPQNEEFGVRAVGSASGMTDRQLAYRNYRSEAASAMAQATVAASQSLNTNGAALANIAVAHGIDANAKHSQADVQALLAIVNDLLGTTGKTGVLQHIENAYRNYIIALGASGSSGMTDEAFKAFAATINGITDESTEGTAGYGTNLDEIKTKLATYNITLKAPIGDAIDKLVATIKLVKEVQGELNALTDEEITWAQISGPLNKLANTSAMTLNGYKIGEVKDNLGAIAGQMGNGGLQVVISTGGGVYADVADHCGDFHAAITLEDLAYGEIELGDVDARMKTNTTVDDTPNGTTQWGDVYLNLLGAAVNLAGAPTGEGGQTMPVSDFFGYIIDLAFRTNAAESNLLLQADAVDRIYEGSTGAEITSEVNGQERTESTMGHGATMTFTTADSTFTMEKMKDLMRSIRIVFFDPDNGNVIATAKLDVDNAEIVGGTTITAKIYVYTNTAADSYVTAKYDANATGVTYYKRNVSYTQLTDEQAAAATEQLYIKNEAEGTVTYESVTYAADSDQTYFTQQVSYAAADDAATTTEQLYILQKAGEVKVADNKIMALPQNTPVKLSVLVYLDGESVTNADVAATGTESMTGTMNLQFSSSATLVPMDYTPLMPQGTNNNGTQGTPAETTTPANP